MTLTGKQQSFIEHYTGDCHGNATKAYKMAGYADSTGSRVNACRLLTTDNIKVEIAKKRAKSAEKAEFTTQKAQSMYQSAYDLAERCRQPSAMNGSVLGMARLYGMDKDAGMGSKDVPKPLSDKDLAMLKKMATALSIEELEPETESTTLKLHTAQERA